MHLHGTSRRTTAIIALAMTLLVGSAALLAGCTGTATNTDPKRLKLEAVAKFFIAASNGDKAGAQALAVNPDSPLVASIGAGGSAKATWAWTGDVIVMDLGTATVTLSPSPTKPDSVDAADKSGTAITFDVKLVSGTWKVDTTALESGASGASAEADKNSCFANQRTIEGAYQTAMATDPGTKITAVSDLVGSYLKTEPVCPTTKEKYTLLAGGIVKDCTAHGHY
jgi:hypothetical protein